MEGKWANIKRKFLEVKNFLDPVIKYTPPRCLSELLELQDVPDIIPWLLVSVWFFSVLSHTLWVSAKSLQLCPTFCDPMDCSPPGSSAHGILQVGILEWVSMPSFKWLNLVSGITCIGRSVNCKVCPILFLDSWYQSGSFQLYPALRELKFFDLCLGDSLVSRFQFDAWDSSWGCWWETEIVSSSSNGLECGLWQTAFPLCFICFHSDFMISFLLLALDFVYSSFSSSFRYKFRLFVIFFFPDVICIAISFSLKIAFVAAHRL